MWIDFKAVQQSVSVVRYLESRGWLWTARAGVQYRGPCVLHGSTCPKSRTFGANGYRWYCWKCRRGGNVLGLVAEIERVTLREAAELLISRFGVLGATLPVPLSSEQVEGQLRRAQPARKIDPSVRPGYDS